MEKIIALINSNCQVTLTTNKAMILVAKDNMPPMAVVCPSTAVAIEWFEEFETHYTDATNYQDASCYFTFCIEQYMTSKKI